MKAKLCIIAGLTLLVLNACQSGEKITGVWISEAGNVKVDIKADGTLNAMSASDPNFAPIAGDWKKNDDGTYSVTIFGNMNTARVAADGKSFSESFGDSDQVFTKAK